MPPLSLMIKPASSLCTMRCAYCFYRDVAEHRASASYGMMSETLLETLVRRAFTYADGSVSFAFQGGEPTLAGLPFFERLIALQRKHNTRGLQVSNSIQTNGLLIDDAFAKFLAENEFLVGLSIDGDHMTHDRFRPDAEGEPTHARTLEAAARLKKHGAQINVLCVVSSVIAENPEKTFEALSPFGFIQFIPCIDGLDGETSAVSLDPQAYGRFLCHVFDSYERAYRRGKPVSIRDFDNYLQMIAGYPPEHCGLGGVCGRYFLIEGDGSVYPCDFYVLDEWRLGNIAEHSFARLARSPVAEAFVAQSHPLHRDCMACRWRALCRGGCRREREPFSQGKPSRHRLCEGYSAFFAYAYDRMVTLSRELLF